MNHEKRISVLDVTLRDGGCVNNFNFGQVYMDDILAAQESSGVEYIELGYLDEINGSLYGRTQYCSVEAITDNFFKEKKDGVCYLTMMDYGKFDPNKLPERDDGSIDGIRLAFHKKDVNKIKESGRIILDKGYMLFIQPMITLRYSDRELLDLIDMVNEYLPDATAFYIVDSFGEMRPRDVERMVHLVDNNLSLEMALGFHSHNNLQLSYSNAMTLLQLGLGRKLMLDSSIMGMGKGAGNLNTELLLEHINIYYGGHYNIAPLLEVIDSCVGVLHEEYMWGYSPEYYLSSINHCSPTYAGYLYGKHRLRIDQIGDILSSLDESKRISFDKSYVEEKYREYNLKNTTDDSDAVSRLYSVMKNKKVLVVAPGSSIKDSMGKLKGLAVEQDVVTFALNAEYDIDVDYILITRPDAELHLRETIAQRILVSNIKDRKRATDSRDIVIDYKKWIYEDSETRDSAGVICLNLLKDSGAKKLMLAGFDGFSADINDNYFEPLMRTTLTESRAIDRNDFFSKFLCELKRHIEIEFITPTRYEV